jgi:murein DD-endopeptidase MepM/ murein hydrolase activator NlpD
MFRNMRFFVFSNSSLDFREVRFFKTKVVSTSLLLGAVILGAFLLLNHFSSDLLGLGYNRMSLLTAENKILKEQMHELVQKMDAVQASLEKVSERGNELRLLADLSRIDEDTRAAAIGGGTTPTTNAFLSGDASDIIANSQNLIEKLTREVRLQQSSYEEISRKVEFNKAFFAHMPAIKPMYGAYSINGFGMRIHPVLRVYRMHAGIDIINDVGTNVFATGDGVVHFAGRTMGGYGYVIELSHGYGYSTLYAHLAKVLVRPGQTVKRGELIAKSGRSGLVSGPHLHYEVRRNGAKQNPVDYFFDDVDAARYRAQLASAK